MSEYPLYQYSQLRLIEPPINRFHRLIGSKQPGPEVALLSGVDCITNWNVCIVWFEIN